MFGPCLRMVRRTRYDLIHAVEESAFIAAAARRVSGVPYVYDMDSSLAEQMVEAYPGLQFVLPLLRYCESVAVRRSLGVLTVCAALEDVAHGPRPGQAGRPGRGQHAPAAVAGASATATARSRARPAAARSRCTSATWSATRASTCCWKASGTRSSGCPRPTS